MKVKLTFRLTYFRTAEKRHLHGPPIEIRKNPAENCSAYTEATWSCNMSYEREFYGLSEYVRF